MFQQNKYLVFFILILMSVIFFSVSYFGSKIQEYYSGEFNSFQEFYFTVSNFTSALIPIMLFSFIYTTSFIMFILFDIDTNIKKFSLIIAKSFIPILIFSSIYLILLINITTNIVVLKNDIKDQILAFNLTFEDFKHFGIFFWIVFYINLVIQTKIKFKINIAKSFFICTTPSLIVLFIKQFL